MCWFGWLIPRRAVTAGPLRHPIGHRSYRTDPGGVTIDIRFDGTVKVDDLAGMIRDELIRQAKRRPNGHRRTL